jgi:hypothetical protein
MAAKPYHDSKRLAPHWEMLAICLAVVVVSLLFEVRSDDRVAFFAWPSHPVPETCACRALFGIPCPACGLTRSFVHLAHGRWAQSWRAHHLGWLLAAALLFQFPYRFAALRWPEREFLGEHVSRWYVRVVIALLIANWIFVVVDFSRLFGLG